MLKTKLLKEDMAETQTQTRLLDADQMNDVDDVDEALDARHDNIPLRNFWRINALPNFAHNCLFLNLKTTDLP